MMDPKFGLIRPYGWLKSGEMLLSLVTAIASVCDNWPEPGTWFIRSVAWSSFLYFLLSFLVHTFGLQKWNTGLSAATGGDAQFMFIPWVFIEFINICIWLPCYVVSFILSIVFMAAGIKFCGDYPLCARNTTSVSIVTMVCCLCMLAVLGNMLWLLLKSVNYKPMDLTGKVMEAKYIVHRVDPVIKANLVSVLLPADINRMDALKEQQKMNAAHQQKRLGQPNNANLNQPLASPTPGAATGSRQCEPLALVSCPQYPPPG